MSSDKIKIRIICTTGRKPNEEEGELQSLNVFFIIPMIPDSNYHRFRWSPIPMITDSNHLCLWQRQGPWSSDRSLEQQGLWNSINVEKIIWFRFCICCCLNMHFLSSFPNVAASSDIERIARDESRMDVIFIGLAAFEIAAFFAAVFDATRVCVAFGP